jgi:hypothetical protein
VSVVKEHACPVRACLFLLASTKSHQFAQVGGIGLQFAQGEVGEDVQRRIAEETPASLPRDKGGHLTCLSSGFSTGC